MVVQGSLLGGMLLLRNFRNDLQSVNQPPVGLGDEGGGWRLGGARGEGVGEWGEVEVKGCEVGWLVGVPLCGLRPLVGCGGDKRVTNG